MKKIMYRLFGHKWKYYLTSSVGGNPRMDFRVCVRTNKVQYLITDRFTKQTLNDGKPFWMNCVGYTDQGAVNHYSFDLLK